MCGRYTLSSPSDILSELFEIEGMVELSPRFNITPSQEAAIVRISAEGGKRELALLRWGLVPFWAKDPSIGDRMINARSETVAEKPSFRASFKRKRCIVAADGFYEWGKIDGRKQPHHFRMEDGAPFGLAGLWDRWDKGDGAPIESFTILTSEPNERVAPIHHRMPVILRQEHYASWLDPGIDNPQILRPMLEPFPAGPMVAYPVSTYVNSPANDSPECIQPWSQARPPYREGH